MELSWDEEKRQRTLQERGLDFADVALVDWDRALTLADLRCDYGEDRYITYAKVHRRLCVIAWCYREDSVRVFSLRKANKREMRRHDQD